jgi:DNA polymerase II small subunit/DNA polymerase delta subunit B
MVQGIDETDSQNKNEGQPSAAMSSKGKDSKFKDLIELEFDIQQDISDLKECSGPLKIVEDHNAEIKEKINKLHKLVKVSGEIGNSS